MNVKRFKRDEQEKGKRMKGVSVEDGDIEKEKEKKREK